MDSPVRITAIVPALDEEAMVVGCLEALRGAGLDDIVVVDGGSRDATRALAGPLADRVLEAPGGLFAQLVRGAEVARGDVLLFQYADGRLASDGRSAIERALARPDAVGGAFRLAFDSDDPFFRLVALGAAARNRLGFGPFGDQSIFVRRDAYRHAGGFDPAAPLADHELVRRLSRRGRFVLLTEPVVTSARRWREAGRLRTLVAHQGVSLRYLLGFGRRGGRLGRQVERLRRTR